MNLSGLSHFTSSAVPLVTGSSDDKSTTFGKSELRSLLQPEIDVVISSRDQISLPSSCSAISINGGGGFI